MLGFICLTNSLMIKYSKNCGHREVSNSDIKIVEFGNSNNKKKRKIAEALIFKNTQSSFKKKNSSFLLLVQLN